MAGLLEKDIFKVVIIANILTNADIVISYFVDKIKNISINKVYEKSWPVIQAYNNQGKNLVSIQLQTIQ